MSGAGGRIGRAPRGVWLFAAAFALATTLPFLVGAAKAPPGGSFTGSAAETLRVDYHSYLAKLQLGAMGEWGERSQFTAEAHPSVFTRTFYIALGHAARLTGLPVVLTYQLARVVAAVALVVMIWRFAARFLPGDRARWTALLLATVVGGLGWLLYVFAPASASEVAPIEFWMPEAFTFSTAMSFPHFAATVALALAFFLVFEAWLESPNWRGAAWAALIVVFISWLQPFEPLLTGLTAGIVALGALATRRLRWSQALMLTPVAVAHGIGPLYHYVALSSHPVWRAETVQNVNLSPPPVYYLLAYLWLLAPALVGLWGARRDTRLLLPAVWLLATAALLYAPLQMQRRFILGAQVPLAVLAASGLERLYAGWMRRGGARKGWRLLLAGALLLSAITHLFLLASALEALDPAAHPKLFISADEETALAWLRAQPPETLVFGAFDAGNKVAAHSGRRVYVGHWIETPDFEAKAARVAQFFDLAGMADAERLSLLIEAGVDYVWYDAAARELGGWEPSRAAFLRPVLATETVTVYEVAP